MKLASTNNLGVKFFEMEPFEDKRGFFARNFCSKLMKETMSEQDVAQANLSFNREIGTLRGFHFQYPPFQESKTITVLQGSLHYKVIDLRPNSSTYLSVCEFNLNSLQYVVQIPKGCAPAFQTLSENSLLHYYVSNFYNKDFEDGIRYDDPFFNLKWPIANPIVSERDSGFDNFNIKNYEKRYFSNIL